MHLFCVFWAKWGHLRRKWIFMDFHGAFSLINEKEKDKYTIWELVYELWINYEFYKENTKFSGLNSFCLSSMIHLGLNSISNGFMNELWEVTWIFDSEIIFIRPNHCSLCYFKARYICLGLKPLLLTQFRMYQIYLSSQSSVLAVTMNQAVH